MNPLVSIIIPTYNRAPIIGETLDSILVQTYGNWECIVVDDGSTDNTSEILQSYIDKDSRFHYYHRPKRKLKGPSSCRNYGFNKSRGEFVNFLDSDDFYFPNTLEKIINIFGSNDDAIVSKIDFIDFHTKTFLRQNIIKSTNIIEEFFVEKINYYVCGPLWRKSFLKKQKYLFDEEIGIGDDWDFNFRMLCEKPNLGLINEPMFQVRSHNNSFSKEKNKLNKKEWLSELKALNKNYLVIKDDNTIDQNKIKDYLLKRYNRPLKWAIIQNKDIKYFFLKNKLLKQLEFRSYKKMIKTLAGFILFSVFGKGYRFLKDD